MSAPVALEPNQLFFEYVLMIYIQMTTNFAQDLLGCDLQGPMVNREQNFDRDLQVRTWIAAGARFFTLSTYEQ